MSAKKNAHRDKLTVGAEASFENCSVTRLDTGASATLTNCAVERIDSATHATFENCIIQHIEQATHAVLTDCMLPTGVTKKEHERVIAERDEALAERNALRAQLRRARADSDAHMAARHAAVVQRDKLASALDHISIHARARLDAVTQETP